MIIRITTFCLPSIVVASGLIIAWGNNGYFTQILNTMGLDPPFPKIIYSPQAIIWANSLMNLPFCSAILFRRILDLADEQLKSAEILGLSTVDMIRVVIWPAIRPLLLYFGGLSFLLSMGSFGALSILGSGPQAQTLEMAIYHAIYYSADWELGGVLTILHTTLCGIFAFLTIWSLNRSAVAKASAKRNMAKLFQIRSLLFPSGSILFISCSMTLLFDVLVLSPIIAVAGQAWRHILSGSFSSSSRSILSALKVSLSFALPAAGLITLAAWILSRSHYRVASHGEMKAASIIQLATISGAIIPPMALGFGLLVLQSSGYFFSIRQQLIASALTVAMLPFAISIFLPSYGSRLASSNQSRLLLGLKESTFFHKVEWPALRLSAFIVFALSLALCLNETSIVTILGDATSPALTATMIRLMNQYRFGDSSIVATLLIVSTFSVVLYFYKSEGAKDA
jgi:thiamine transport system permease protein